MRARAGAFARDWRGETREAAERQTFWNEWFEVFGIHRRRFVTFERNVKKLSGTTGQIDAFWPGMLLIEHKSAGEDLDAALEQAEGYLLGLREEELPRLIVLSDFARFRVLNLETRDEVEFSLDEFPERIELFTFLAGYRPRWFEDQDEVNVQAAEIMGRLHDRLATTGYTGHQLRVLLVRLVFLMFADDTGALGETGAFEDFIERKTAEDGSDLGPHLERLFQVLDTPVDQRQSTLGEPLQQMPYINGQLFAEHIPMADFDQQMRIGLLLACRFNWSKISPAVFGSLFQSVMKPEERQALGAHYTTEQNIMKVIRALFLDELEAELQATRSQRPQLRQYLAKLRSLTFFDPACGCGNFLVIAYREIRRLELETLKRLRDLDPRGNQMLMDATVISEVDVDQFYGIEIEEFPCRIAEVAMYLTDHLANQQLSEEFGLYYARFPLHSPARIHNRNALELDWADVLAPERCSYLLGNPPFVAKKRRTTEQAGDMARVFDHARGSGELDYVAAWIELASHYIAGTAIRAGLVATNSCVQGEQVWPLWPRILDRDQALDFAHRSFRWTSEARGVAAVHVIIIGFSERGQRPTKLLYDYETPTSEPQERVVKRINPYLTDGPDVVVYPQKAPPKAVPAMRFGSMPNDDGGLIVKRDDHERFLSDPIAAKYLRPLLGAREVMSGTRRWCLWLTDVAPEDIRDSALLRSRIEHVAKYRAASGRAATKKLAATPALFGEIRQPTSRYILVPRHGSQRRAHLPMVLASPDEIAHDSTLTVETDDLYWFGLLQSQMFAAWVRGVGGRIKGDPRISAEMTYNTFPWPIEPGSAAANRVRDAAQAVLDSRDHHGGTTLDVLYDSVSMPSDLTKAHAALDRVTDALYGRGTFDELKRLATLLRRYQGSTL